jgi:DNA-binding transcriptional ArsR family regulator
MKDDIESLPQEPEACEMKTPGDHRIMFKALENPLRRKIVKSIGAFGKTRQEIIKELGISESQLKFQLDFLIKECYAELEGEKCRLNAKGLQELLSNIR